MGRAALLCGIAGYVDALGYLTLGSVFAANMTGNTVLFAIMCARGDWQHAGTYALTLAVFIAGAIVASALKRASHPHDWLPLLAQATLFAFASILPLEPTIELALLAFGMGLQGTSITSFEGTSLNTVVVTATMCRIAGGVVDAVWPAGRMRPETTGRTALRISCVAWGCYAAGAFVEVLLFASLRMPLIIPAILIAGLAGRLVIARKPS